ncbi:MAG TPA: Ig-like domain-containing protein, partial [Verrucomicrobiae bacterium]
MKKLKILKNRAAHVFLSMAMGVIAIIGVALPAHAGLTGPYTNDFYTLHLWHMQDTNGTIAGVATNGVFEFDYATNALVVPLLLSNTPGPDLIGGTSTAYSQAGQAGPGTGPLFLAVGTNFGYALSIQTTQTTAFYAPWDNISGTDFPDPSYTETNDSCSFVNTNTGAFTWEALIQPGFNPLTDTADKNPEILCTDGPNSTTPGANPYTVRAVQFRFDNATPSSGQAELEFNGNITSLAGESHDFIGMLPTTGPDALTQGTWYHIAAAFTGTSPTNGDPPNVFTLYWTKFDPTRTTADVLTNIANAFTFTNTSSHTVFSLPYPSNSIIGTGPFVIGQSARLSAGAMSSGGGWKGNIAEVRISDYYRHSNEFMFNNSIVPSKPLVTGPTTNNFVGYGQTLNLNLQVSGSQPYAYQWYQSGVALAGQTNSTLVLSNITYAANTETFDAIVTNGYGSATSAVATVTVGATFDSFFNTGVGPNYNPLDQTAPGSVDLHWMFTANGNPDNNSPNAVVWNDGSPLASGGGVAPDNGASVWVWAHENSGKVSGTYSLQTTFQLDETVVTNTVISGTIGALGATGGTIMQMFLNGVETDVTLSGNPAENVYAFTITNGIQPGSNTLVCTASQSGSGTAGNNGFNLAVLSDTGVALTNAPDIINEPANTTNVLGSTVSFQAVALGAPPLTYYWLSNGVAITAPVWVYTAVPYLSFVATNFSPSELTGTNFFANYQIVFSNFVGSVTSAVATLDVQVPPLTVVSAGVPVWDLSNNETNIVVYFSGAVDPTTATTAGNYTVNGDTVASAVLGSAPGEVILTLSSPLSTGSSYTLTIQNVNSAFGIGMNPSSASLSVGTYPTTVALWIRSGSGVTADGSGNVSQWNDLSGNGNNLVTGGSDPQLVQNAIDGQPMVEFTGTNGTYLIANDAPSLRITGDMSIFTVVNFATLAGGTNGDIVSKVNNNNEPAPYDYYAQPGNVHFLRGNGTASAQVASTNSPSTGVPHILDVVMQGTTVTHRLDANPDGSGTLNTQIADQGQPLSIGAREDFHNFLTGGMAELIVVSSALSSSDVASMENYLATEYHMPTGTNSYPVITQEPIASTNLNQGAVLIVPAAASGTPAVAYQWYDVNNIAQ